MSYGSRATILRIHANISRLSGEKLKQGRHECHETRSRMSRDFRTNENEAKATFVGIRKTPTNV